MYQTSTGRYDEIPEGMKVYINNYGCHFNKKLCKEATSRMYKRVNGRKEYITPYSKEKVDTLLSKLKMFLMMLMQKKVMYLIVSMLIVCL